MKLTHWVPAAENMTGGLSWVWPSSCLKGGVVRAIEEGGEMEDTLREMFREAAKVVH